MPQPARLGLRISEFKYELPSELIAQKPLERRDQSRMLVLDRAKRTWSDSQFVSLPGYLKHGDVLVINDTRVFPARLIGQREPSGGRVEILLVRELEPLLWEALVRPARRIKRGDCLEFADSRLRAEVIDQAKEGMRTLRNDGVGKKEAVRMLQLAGYTPKEAWKAVSCIW